MCKNRDSGPGISRVLLARSRKQALNRKSSQVERDLQRRDAEICKARIGSSESDKPCQPSDKNIDASKDGSTRNNSDDDLSDDDGYNSPRKLHCLQGTNSQKPTTQRSMTEVDLVEYARKYSGLRPRDNYVNIPTAPKPPPDPVCETDTSTSIRVNPTRTNFFRSKLAMSKKQTF